MTNEYKTTHMTNIDTYKGCEDRTGVINKFVIAVFMFTTIPLLVLAPIFSGAVLAKSSTDKLLRDYPTTKAANPTTAR